MLTIETNNINWNETEDKTDKVTKALKMELKQTEADN